MSADRSRASELWLRLLAGETLSVAEEDELLKTLSSDPALREELEQDEQLDGILRSLGRAGTDAAMFAREFVHREAADRDKVRFSQGIRARIEEESSSRAGESRRPSRPATRQGLRRGTSPSSRAPWMAALAAAGLLMGLVVVATIPKAASRPPLRDAARRPTAVSSEEDQRRKADEDRSRARAERQGIEERLASIEQERRRLEAARSKADRDKQDELRRRADEDLARIAAEHRAAVERLERAKAAERNAQEPLRPAKDPAAPETPRQATRVVIASVERVAGEVLVVSEGKSAAAQTGQELLAGQGLDVRGPGSRAVVVYPDKTRLEVLAEAEVRNLQTERGKRMVLERGTLRADVTPQSQDQPMVITTPHGEAKVLGTTLRLRVDSEATRLDVIEGKVRLTRKADGRSVEVPSGHYAVAATGIELVVKAVGPDTPAVRLLESAGVLTINFGPEGLSLPDKVLNDSGEEFDLKRGYGWKGPKEGAEVPGVFRKDEGGRVVGKIFAGRGTAVHPTFPDPLRGSCVAAGWASHAETWTMPVPNGRYLVTVCVGFTGQGEGSIGWEQGPHHVWVEGKQIFNAVLTKMGKPFAEQKDVPVEVRDGELTLRAGGYGGNKTSLDGSCDTILNFLVIKKAP